MAYKQELWNEAKKKCRIGEEEIRMAKEMGLNPKSLIKNIPSKSEMWKAPVKDLKTIVPMLAQTAAVCYIY